NLQLLKTHSSVSSRIKRSIDIFGSLVEWGITGVLLIPILIAIELDSPGAIFSKQTRCRWIKNALK
ncbi:MAG: anti-anti-sigma factor, partial [cyanobacterium endosymbiont of Rhopalodia yunnanensis]